MTPIPYDLTEAGWAVTEETEQTETKTECAGERIDYAVAFSTCDGEPLADFLHNLCECQDVAVAVRKKGHELGACHATVMRMRHGRFEILPGVVADSFMVDVSKVQIH